MTPMDLTKRTRIRPRIPTSVMPKLHRRLLELGLHASIDAHFADLTWLFISRGWVMVNKAGHNKSVLYPPDKHISNVVNELGEW